MNIENTTVVIEPRTVGACLDLALLFYRRHARRLLPATLAFAVPGALLTYALVRWSADGFFWSLVAFFFTSPLLGAVLVIGSGHAVFGAPLEPWTSFWRAERRWSFLFAMIFSRIFIVLAGLPCLGLTALPTAVYMGFLPEVMLLEQVAGGRARERLSELMRQNFANLLGRAMVLTTFACGAVLTLFILVDQSVSVLFGWPLLWGRVHTANMVDDAFALITGDAWVAAVLAAVVWLVYPLARLAWFFCYLDSRIRKEGWDLELDFRVEARRLEALA